MPRAPLEAAFPFMETHRSYVLAHASQWRPRRPRAARRRLAATAARALPLPLSSSNRGPTGQTSGGWYVLEGSAPLLRAARAGEGTPVGLVTDAAGRVEFHMGTPALVASLAAAADGDRAPRPAKRPRAAARLPRVAAAALARRSDRRPTPSSTCARTLPSWRPPWRTR